MSDDEFDVDEIFNHAGDDLVEEEIESAIPQKQPYLTCSGSKYRIPMIIIFILLVLVGIILMVTGQVNLAISISLIASGILVFIAIILIDAYIRKRHFQAI